MNSELSIDTLLNYHKQEASEELTYLTIVFTVVLALLSYVGTANKVDKVVRVFISIIFLGFYFIMLQALGASAEIHDGLHDEIKNRVMQSPEMFVSNKQSMLYIAITDNMVPHDKSRLLLSGIFLGIMTILGVLTIGEGRVFSLAKFILKKKRSKAENP